MRYWLGPWVWNALAECWEPPPGTVGAIDTRNRTHCRTAGGTPQGFGIFVTPDDVNLGGDYAALGNDLGAVLNGSRKSAIRTLLKLPRTLAGNTLSNAIYEALTVQSDPTDEDRCPPLVPTAGRNLEIWLAGEKILSKRFHSDLEEAKPVRELLSRAYRQYRKASLDQDNPRWRQHYKKILGYWVIKYGIPARWFQPDDLPDEKELPPETTLTDDFNRADADALGTASGGGTWAETNHDIDIVSNAARGITDSNITTARLESDLSSVDHYCELTISNPGGSTSNVRAAGPVCRYSSSVQDFYVARQTNGAVNGTYQPSKVVGGTRTALGSGASRAVLALKRLITSGTTIETYHAGVLVESITDSSISTGTRCGFFFDRSNNNLAVDGWSAADLSSGGVVTGQASLDASVESSAAGRCLRRSSSAIDLSLNQTGLGRAICQGGANYQVILNSSFSGHSLVRGISSGAIDFNVAPLGRKLLFGQSLADLTFNQSSFARIIARGHSLSDIAFDCSGSVANFVLGQALLQLALDGSAFGRRVAVGVSPLDLSFNVVPVGRLGKSGSAGCNLVWQADFLGRGIFAGQSLAEVTFELTGTAFEIFIPVNIYRVDLTYSDKVLMELQL